MSFHYFHPYMPETFEAQIKAGLIGKGSGIRFCQSIDIEERLKFNNLARENGELFGIIKELKAPFYIDRLQGGCFFEGYDYDMALIGKYKELLGDDFYGFQMHEWMSNVISDIDKLVRGRCPEPWTAENITETLKRDFPYEHIFTEAMSVEEMAQAGHIRTLEIYIDEMKKLFEKRQNYTGGCLLPCDSAILAYPLEFRSGAKRVMPEIGRQTPDTCVQIAYARGMAKAYGKSFGAYYEPWGGEPFSACNFHREGKNEWNISRESFPFKTEGDNGGSSRSLQKRLQLYAYVAGAEFYSEEWGMCNTFYDWHDFELTPYGKIKLDFIKFTEKYPDIGKPLTPVAAVIPKEIIALDNIHKPGSDYLSFPTEPELARQLEEMRSGLNLIFGGGETFGNENGCLVNRLLPDAADIVNEDVFDDKKYEFAVNLTGRKNFENHHKCIEPEQVEAVLKEILPCTVSGGLHHIINKSESCHYLTVFNNTGIIRSVADGEILLKEAEKTVKVNIKSGSALTMLEGDASIKSENGNYYITVPAGGFFFGRF